MKRALLVLMVPLLIVLVGCASKGAPPVFQGWLAHEDPFKPGWVYQYSDNIRLLETSFPWAHFNVNHLSKEGVHVWRLNTSYRAREWMFVKQLSFVVDGAVWSFETAGNPKREVIQPGLRVRPALSRDAPGSIVWENVKSPRTLEENGFVVCDEFMDSVCLAEDVTVRLAGDHNLIQRTLTPEDIFNFKWFIEFVRNDGFGVLSKDKDEDEDED